MAFMEVSVTKRKDLLLAALRLRPIPGRRRGRGAGRLPGLLGKRSGLAPSGRGRAPGRSGRSGVVGACSPGGGRVGEGEGAAWGRGGGEEEGERKGMGEEVRGGEEG